MLTLEIPKNDDKNPLKEGKSKTCLKNLTKLKTLSTSLHLQGSFFYAILKLKFLNAGTEL